MRPTPSRSSASRSDCWRLRRLPRSSRRAARRLPIRSWPFAPMRNTKVEGTRQKAEGRRQKAEMKTCEVRMITTPGRRRTTAATIRSPARWPTGAAAMAAHPGQGDAAGPGGALASTETRSTPARATGRSRQAPSRWRSRCRDRPGPAGPLPAAGTAEVTFTAEAGHRYEVEVRADAAAFSSRAWQAGEWIPVVRDRSTDRIVSDAARWVIRCRPLSRPAADSAFCLLPFALLLPTPTPLRAASPGRRADRPRHAPSTAR